jgi:hypothetical protein
MHRAHNSHGSVGPPTPQRAVALTTTPLSYFADLFMPTDTPVMIYSYDLDSDGIIDIMLDTGDGLALYQGGKVRVCQPLPLWGEAHSCVYRSRRAHTAWMITSLPICARVCPCSAGSRRRRARAMALASPVPCPMGPASAVRHTRASTAMRVPRGEAPEA